MKPLPQALTRDLTTSVAANSAVCGPRAYVKNGPKHKKRARKAMILHAVGVQLAASCV